MSLHTLADLGILGHDGDGAIGGDTNERSGIEGGGRRLWRLGLRRYSEGTCDRLEMISKEKAASRNGRDTEKGAAIKERGVHGTSFGERCDSGGGRHLRQKHCKPIL